MPTLEKIDSPLADDLDGLIGDDEILRSDEIAKRCGVSQDRVNADYLSQNPGLNVKLGDIGATGRNVKRWLRQLRAEVAEREAAIEAAKPAPQVTYQSNPKALESARQTHEKALATLGEVFAGLRRAEASHADLVNDLDRSVKDESEQRASDIIAGAAPANKTGAAISKQRQSVADSEAVLSILRHRHGTAAAVEVEARHALRTAEANEAGASGQAKKKEITNLQVQLVRLQNEQAALESQKIRLEREGAALERARGERVGVIRGSLAGIETVMTDHLISIDHTALAKLLGEWRKGLAEVNTVTKTPYALQIAEGAVYYDKVTGAILGSDILKTSAGFGATIGLGVTIRGSMENLERRRSSFEAGLPAAS